MGILSDSEINAKMIELANKLEYKDFCIKNSHLTEAMKAIKTGESNEDRTNCKLASIGDSLIDLAIVLICHHSCIPNSKIDNIRQDFARNEVQYQLFKDLGLFTYAYNNEHFASENDILLPNESVFVSEKGFQYLEAIIGAMYLDKGKDVTIDYIINWYLTKAVNYVRNLDNEKRAMKKDEEIDEFQEVLNKYVNSKDKILL